MIPIQILMEEHQIILKGLEVLEKMAESAREKGEIPQSAGEILDFIRNFADKTHHSKEEDQLFIAMGEQGFPTDGGPIGVMLHEHNQGRDAVAAMTRALEKPGDKDAVQSFCRHGRNFISLLRDHIQKEDQILYPIAEENLPQEVMDQLHRDFQAVEAKAGGKRHSQYIEVIKGLCEQYQVAFVEPSVYATLAREYLQ